MANEQQNPDLETKCKVTTLKNNVFQTGVFPESEVLQIKPRDYGLYIDMRRLIIIAKMADGKLHEVDQRLNGIKGQPLSVLLKLLRFHGVPATPYQIGKMPPDNDSHFINENIIQYVAKLRKHLFKEEGRNAKYIVTHTHSYRVAFNGESFCLIESLDEPVEKNGKNE